MRDTQVQIVDARFNELKAKLEERRNALLKEVTSKFDNAIFKLQDGCRESKALVDEVAAFDKYASDLRLGESEQAVLRQIPEAERFVQENRGRLNELEGKAKGLVKEN